MLISLAASSIYLGIISFALNQPFYGFSNEGWLVLFAQAAICQLLAWSLISYATQHMRATRVSVSLLAVSYTHLDVYKRQTKPCIRILHKMIVWEL